MFWKSKDDEVVLPKTYYERERYMQNKIKELEETIEKLTNEIENEEVVFYTDDYEVIKLCNENIELKEKQKELEQEIRWRMYTNKTSLEQRDLEIKALKHMLDRKDEEQ